MATYYVKTNAVYVPLVGITSNDAPAGQTQSRTIVIEADRFEKDNSGDYFFYKKNPTAKKAGILVAAVNSRDVLAVLDAVAYQDDFLKEPLAKVEFRSYFNSPAWGVSAEGHFIPFGGDARGKESAEGNAQDYKPGEWVRWCSEPIENCPLIEEAK